MTIRLSIIIPCFNSASTLKESVDSCFTQGLDPATFEIIMVDDGSNDTTRTVMETIAAEHGNITLLFHPENRGGGAARNTGIKASRGDIIYCLDSDNFFAPTSVLPMLEYLEEHQLDGVVYYDRCYFSGSDTRRYQSHINNKLETDIVLEDVFSIDSHILLDNFFYTKAAFAASGGYPEHHGFDTQCFEFRFLGSGLRAQVVPHSVFYHRQDPDHNSYFERVYKQGYFSRNYYLMCEEILHLFSPTTRGIIMNFDVFQKSKLDTTNLKAVLDTHAKTYPGDFLLPEYRTYQTPSGRTDWLVATKESREPTDIFTRAVRLSGDTKYHEAHDCYRTLLENGIDSDIMYFNILRLSLSLTNKYPARTVVDETTRLITRLHPKTQSFSRVASALFRSARTVRGILKW